MRTEVYEQDGERASCTKQTLSDMEAEMADVLEYGDPSSYTNVKYGR